MGTIRARLTGDQPVTAVITLDAMDDLNLMEGQPVVVLSKPTAVCLATGPVAGLSIRDQIPGMVENVEHGAVMTTVTVAITGGRTVTAAITKDGAEDLSPTSGDAVSALVEVTEVSVAVE